MSKSMYVYLTTEEYLAVTYILESVRTVYTKSNKRASITLRNGEQKNISTVLNKLRNERINSLVKLHAHFCSDCGNDWQCKQEDCPGVLPGEQSKECPTCLEAKIE